MFWIVVVAAGLWFALGTPAKTAANWFWPDSAAPWESVDAFYYPDRSDLTESQAVRGLKDVDACRGAVNSMAYLANDPAISRGDYECGIGPTGQKLGSISVYRVTAK